MTSAEIVKFENRFGKKGVLLRKRMAEFARQSVLRVPPFDSLLEVESCFDPYKKYIEIRSCEQQEVLINAFLKYMGFIISGEICRDVEAMATWAEIDKEFQRDFASNYVPISLKKVEIKHSEVKKIIGNEFNRELSEFDFYKAGSNMIGLSKQNEFAEKITVVFDMGTFGEGRFSVFVGTANPIFSTELSSILCIRKRSWRYVNREECVLAINEVIGLLKLLLPQFEIEIKEALQNESNIPAPQQINGVRLD